MGVDYGSAMIYGWRVEYDVLVKWLLDLGVTQDTIDEEGITGAVDVINDAHVPKGWMIDSTSPEYDSDEKDQVFTLSLILDENISLQKLLKKIKASDVEGAKKLAERLKCEHVEPKFFSEVNVW